MMQGLRGDFRRKFGSKAIIIYLFVFQTEVKNVVYMLLNPEADQRPTLKQVLQHPWFSMEV